MSRQHGSGDEIVKHLPGIFQSLVAAALGSGLLPTVKLGWLRLFHTQLVDAAQSSVTNVIAAIVLIPAFRLLTRPLSVLAARRFLGKTPEIKGDRLAIYVAHFGFDELSRTARDRVIASIRKEFGSNLVEALPAGIYLGLPEAMTEDSLTEDVRRKARALLQKTHGDLVVLGKVIVLPAMKPQIDLRFVSAADQFSPDSFGFSDKLLLDQDFGLEVGMALAAIIMALAKPAFDVGSYSVETLQPVANRLIPLIHSIPTAMENYCASLLFSYGLIQTTIGKQLGDRTRIEDAIAVFHEALKNWTDKQVIDRALIQNNLGSALFTLGEWEQGTARLEQADLSFTEAQKEWTRQRAPKQWAAAKHNLGCVLYRLAERKHESVLPSGAVGLFQEALTEQSYEQEPLAWAMTQSSLGN